MKALALFSGGLDSRLAILLLKKQKIKIEAVHFALPFEGGCCKPWCAFNFTQKQGIKLHIIDCKKGKLFNEYIKMIKKPKHGYGSAFNPCIDCHIFMLKKSKRLAKQIGADLIVTGEVLNQRPFSQKKYFLELIENEAGLQGKILRPLSAKLLPETEAEKKGLVNREKLLGINGRSRKEQMALAKKFKLKYPSPAGGCLLCEKEFAIKLKDLFEHEEKVSSKELNLLKVGRHFRLGKDKIVVGRNKEDNEKILSLKEAGDYYFEVPRVGSPTTLLQGKGKEAIKLAASLTARYSDAKGELVLVKYGKEKLDKEIKVKQLKEKEIKKFKVK